MTEYKWQEVYKAVLLETDWSKMEERIQAAEAVLHERKREFDSNHGGTPEENQAIEDGFTIAGPFANGCSRVVGATATEKWYVSVISTCACPGDRIKSRQPYALAHPSPSTTLGSEYAGYCSWTTAKYYERQCVAYSTPIPGLRLLEKRNTEGRLWRKRQACCLTWLS
jgi:hypothetical protein